MKVQLDIQFGDQKHAKLVETLIEAHQLSAGSNANGSSTVAAIAYAGSGSFTQAIIGALSTTGLAHAPIGDARALYTSDDPRSLMKSYLAKGMKIPGFGNSFYKNGDPAYDLLDSWMHVHYNNELMRIIDLELEAQDLTGKPLSSNAAMYTAAVCEIVGIPKGKEMMLFAVARIPVWANP